MKPTIFWRGVLALFCLCGITAGAQTNYPVQAQTNAVVRKVELTDLIRETQKMGKVPGAITVIWWIPEDYWRISLTNTGRLTPEVAEKMLQVFHPYTMVGVVDGTIGSMGAVTYVSNAEARAAILLQDSHGHAYEPLDDAVLSEDARGFVTLMKPLLANAMGAMGKNFHFFLFPAVDAKGQVLVDPRSEGSMTIVYKGNEFKWRLPLASLLPPKICPKCLEKLPGNYKFCPWDGTPLPEPGK